MAQWPGRIQAEDRAQDGPAGAAPEGTLRLVRARARLSVCLSPREEAEIPAGSGGGRVRKWVGDRLRDSSLNRRFWRPKEQGAAALAQGCSRTGQTHGFLNAKQKPVWGRRGADTFLGTVLTVPRTLQGHLKILSSTFSSTENCLVYSQSYLRLLSERTLSMGQAVSYSRATGLR